MDFTVEMSCVMKVNRNCDYCRRKVTEVLHCLHGLYSVDFVGDDGSVKLKGRVNPNVMLSVLERYGEHGKVSNLRFDGEVISFRGGGDGGGYYGQTGYYLPYGPPLPPPPPAVGKYYTYPPPPPMEPRGWMGSQHTAPPLPTLPPPPPRPFYSYLNMEPPSWPMGSPEKCCVIT